MKRFFIVTILTCSLVFAVSCENNKIKDKDDSDNAGDAGNAGDTGDTGNTGNTGNTGDTGDTENSGNSDDADDDQKPDNDSEYVDPCDPNPCKDDNKTVCTDDNTDGIAECDCKEGYVLEEDACINSKFVECDQTDVTVPGNAVIVVENVEILWSDQGWSTPEKCGWECNESYHSEDGETCVSNTKTVNCDQTNIPENATAIVKPIEIAWKNETGWSDSADCEWECDNGYVLNNEKNNCIIQSIVFVDKNATGNESGKTWENAKTNLSEAIDNSFATQQIWVAAGTYQPKGCPNLTHNECVEDQRKLHFTLKNGVIIYGGFKGNETFLDEREPSTNKTILSGDLDENDDNVDKTTKNENVYHVFYHYEIEIDSTAILDGFIIKGGNGNVSDFSHGSGGAMYNNGVKVNPTITNCTFEDNYAYQYAGAVFNLKSSPNITNCTFKNNTSTNFGGGAISNLSNSTAIISNCKFEGNSSLSGGAVYNEGSTPSITNCIFEYNYAKYGGAVFNGSSNPTITNCTLKNNFANTGGGLFNQITTPDLPSNPIIRNTIIWDNTAGTGNNLRNLTETNNPKISYSNIDGCGTSNVSWKTYCGTDLGGNIDADPVFIEGEIHPSIISSNSPCKDAGNNDYIKGINFDIIGNTRIVNNIVDMGAYEMPCNEYIPENAKIKITWENGAPVCSNMWKCNTCFTLNNTEDGCTFGGFENIIFVNKSATGSNTGKTWEDAKTDLSDAIDNSCYGQQIWVAAGTYHPSTCWNMVSIECETDLRKRHFALKSAVAIYGGFAGDETVLNERDITANRTVLSGDFYENDNITDNETKAENTYHVFYHNERNIDETAILDGFTVKGGNADDSTSPHNSGGAMYNFGATVNPTVTNCIFVNNFASRSGGAISNHQSSPAVKNCKFENNSSIEYGGSFYNYDNSNLTITNCTFTRNHSEKGGVAHNNDSDHTVTNCTFTDNFAHEGGAIYNFFSDIKIRNTIIWNNTSDNGRNDLYNYNFVVKPEISNSNIGDCGTSEVDWNTDCGDDGGGNIDTDPMFIGGDDHPLMISYDSPCRNAGSNDFVTTATDIFGVERIIDETVDMGAYEMPCDATNPNIVYDYLEEAGYRCE